MHVHSSSWQAILEILIAAAQLLFHYNFLLKTIISSWLAPKRAFFKCKIVCMHCIIAQANQQHSDKIVGDNIQRCCGLFHIHRWNEPELQKGICCRACNLWWRVPNSFKGVRLIYIWVRYEYIAMIFDISLSSSLSIGESLISLLLHFLTYYSILCRLVLIARAVKTFHHVLSHFALAISRWECCFQLSIIFLLPQRKWKCQQFFFNGKNLFFLK